MRRRARRPTYAAATLHALQDSADDTGIRNRRGAWLIGDKNWSWQAAMADVGCIVSRYGDIRELYDNGRTNDWVDSCRVDQPF